MSEMPWIEASEIKLSERQEKILTQLALGTHTPLHFKNRAHIILKAAEGWSNNAIEANMDLGPKVIKRWRDRYNVQSRELMRIETDTPHKLRSAIEKILSDEQRPGCPPKFKDEQVAAIMAMACEEPSKFELPISHWTAAILRDEAIKLGIVENISVRQVGRFLKRKRFEATP